MGRDLVSLAYNTIKYSIPKGSEPCKYLRIIDAKCSKMFILYKELKQRKNIVAMLWSV